MNQRAQTPRRSGLIQAQLVAPAAAVLLIAGGIAATFAGSRETTFGWFSYAPLSNVTFSSDAGLLFLTRADQIGIVLIGLGLLILAFWSGYRTARRRSRIDGQ